MSSGDVELLDILYSVANDNEARLQVGDLATGKGVGQDVAFLSADGFLGLPNPPAAGAAGQAIVLTLGNDRFVIASLDGRFSAVLGTMAPGDRAIVSNCDARLKLSQAGNSIALSSTNMTVALDGAGGTVTASVGSTQVQLTTTSASMSLAGGGSVTVGAAAVTLAVGGTTLVVDVTGVHITTAPPVPGALVINGTPVTVP
jgi:hypothetical protein